MFKVLVFAMLSSASGWGLPKDDPLSSNDTGGVDGARDQRQLQYRGGGKGGGYYGGGKGDGGGNGPICTGVTTVANSPFGTYAAEGIITVTFPKITDLLKVPFTRKVGKDGPEERFTEGAFEGSHFIPTPAEDFTDRLDIQWCPNQNYFQVKVKGVDGSNTLVYTPSCDSSCNGSCDWFWNSCDSSCNSSCDGAGVVTPLPGNPVEPKPPRPCKPWDDSIGCWEIP